MIKNPREVKRFFNHLRFVLEQIEGQVCFSDLFALSIIATKATPLYEHIKKNPEAYIGCRLSNDDFDIEETEDILKPFAKEREKQLDNYGANDHKLINGLLGEIFPLVESNNFSIYGSHNADAAGRISAPQRLHIALHYTTPAGYISDQDILKFIAGDIDRNEFFERVLKEEADERFFEMMTNYSAKCKENSFDILVCIYDAFLKSEKLKISLENNFSFMSLDPYRQMRWLTDRIITENKGKYELIKRLVSRKENAPLGAAVLYTVRKKIKVKSHDEPWISEEQLNNLEEIFQGTAIKALSEKLFIDNHLESEIFYELERSSKDKAVKFISDILNNENGVIRVAEIIRNSGSDSINGPYVKIEEEIFSDVIDFADLREKACKVDTQDLPIDIQAVIKSILDGKKYYLRDGRQAVNW